MKIGDLLLSLIGGVLLLLIAVFGVRIGEHYPRARLELGRVKLMQLDDGTREKLADLQHDVLITYYVSERTHMPSSLRRIERDVADILEAMKAASGGRLDYQIINPEAGEAFTRHAAHQRVSPFRVRTVSRDSYSERTVWSSLHIAYGPHSAAVIDGVSNEHLARLQALIVGQIAQKDEPRTPVFGVASGEGYRQFRHWLSQHGRVVEVDVRETIPREVDVLFWFDPKSIEPQLIRRVNEFLRDGRSVFVAGSQHEVAQNPESAWEFTFSRTEYDAEALLTAFGLRPIDALVLDESSQSIQGEPAPMPARFLIRCIGYNQDFRTMPPLPNGHLFFAAPTPFALEGEVLAQRGYTPTILATTSERTTLRDMPSGTVRLDRTDVQPGEATLKLPLMVWLRPDKPWHGSLVFAASSSAFRDQMFIHENFAHRRLVDTLARNLASDERLVIHRSRIAQPESLPEVTAVSRLFWRSICILLVPALLGIIAWWRGTFSAAGDLPRRTSSAAWRNGLPLRAFAGLIVVLTAASVVAALGVRADLTKDKLNELAPQTRTIAAQSRGEHAVVAHLHFSRPEHLPPSLRPHVRNLRNMLRELSRAGAELDIVLHAPDDLQPDEHDQLAARGIRPIRATSRDEEVTTVRNIYSTLELGSRSGERREVLHFPDRASFENLEFRLAFALWRLQTGRRPHVAFVADIPRLSSAETYHDFQQRNLFAPTGSDVHAYARQVLEQAGFRVTHINPRLPHLPDEELDLIIWMQPRRDILNLLQQTVDRLHDGVPVMIAAQHFVIQARQYRGTQFETVYWPQPQVADLHRHYLPDIGVELIHEVLFDDMHSSMQLETQVNVGAGERAYDPQASALPFLVRAIAANFDREHPIMRGIGDQVMPFASYIRLDEEQIASHGLTAHPLISTSNRSWTFNWTGGWLLPQLLEGPLRDDENQQQWKHRLPLAVLIEGNFPEPATALTERKLDDRSALEFTDAEGKPSQLLLVGNSYMFRNERIFDADFRADQLLLNAAAHLALDESLSAIASHRRIAPGFDYVEPDERLMWRAVVLSVGPFALLAFGGMWWVARRRESHVVRLVRESESSLSASGARYGESGSSSLRSSDPASMRSSDPASDI